MNVQIDFLVLCNFNNVTCIMFVISIRIIIHYYFPKKSHHLNVTNNYVLPFRNQLGCQIPINQIIVNLVSQEIWWLPWIQGPTASHCFGISCSPCQWQGNYPFVTFDHTNYVVTWNVKTYISHPLKCRMCQNWLKWCSDTPPPPPPLNYNLTFWT